METGNWKLETGKEVLLLAVWLWGLVGWLGSYTQSYPQEKREKSAGKGDFVLALSHDIP